ncbi:MAG: protocatechuate 3,4-dioxygenase, partial [Kordiimonadaceae bacterium]|nr:protocatechuate 3,4-dioxygenase [Kordiimonadaceae bacterium]
GTSEIKNWITTAAIVNEGGLKNSMLDYIPCYRSEAGTGNAMGFMTWG